MDINNVAKVSVEEFSINSSPYGVNLGFRSGPDTQGFYLNPVGAKLLLAALREQVAAIEKISGEIDISGAQKQFPSPLQQPKKP